MARRLANVIGIDDAPFPRIPRARVPVIGAVFSRTRLDGVLISSVSRDGRDATQRIAAMVLESRFAAHVQAVILQGIAVAGFNVVDIHQLHADLAVPVLVVTRRQPNLQSIRRALLKNVSGGARKWALIEQAGSVEPIGRVFVQRAGLSVAQAAQLLSDSTVHGALPEPLRIAHLIAGAVVTGTSRGRA